VPPAPTQGPPPGYAPPPTGYPPPGYAPPPAGYPPPGYAPPTGYAPPPGYAPPATGYAPPAAGSPPPAAGSAPPAAGSAPPAAGSAPPAAGYASSPPTGYAPPPAGYAPPPAGYPPPPSGYPPAYYPPPGGYYPGYYAAPTGYPPTGYPPTGYPPAGYPPVAVARPPVVHVHDGLYLHMDVGLGFTSISSNNNNTSYSGMSTAIGIAGGVTFAPNLIAFGNVLLLNVANPSQNIGGSPVGNVGGSIGWTALGPGLAYYVEPINLYFAGTVAIARANFGGGSNSTGGNGNITSWGLGGQLLVGKEWWVSRNWGLGIAGQVVLSTASDANPALSSINWTTAGFDLLFSVTYN
jgi:hypothetical protein